MFSTRATRIEVRQDALRLNSTGCPGDYLPATHAGHRSFLAIMPNLYVHDAEPEIWPMSASIEIGLSRRERSRLLRLRLKPEQHRKVRLLFLTSALYLNMLRGRRSATRTPDILARQATPPFLIILLAMIKALHRTALESCQMVSRVLPDAL